MLQEWKKNMEEEQAKTPLSVSPKLTIKSITEKMAALDREVKYLVNKAKFWKPKKVEKKASNETKEEIRVNKTLNATEENQEKVENVEVTKDEAENTIVQEENVVDSAQSESPEETTEKSVPVIEEEKLETNKGLI